MPRNRCLFCPLSDTALLHFDTDFNHIYGYISFNHIMYASQNYSTME